MKIVSRKINEKPINEEAINKRRSRNQICLNCDYVTFLLVDEYTNWLKENNVSDLQNLNGTTPLPVKELRALTCKFCTHHKYDIFYFSRKEENKCPLDKW